MCIKLPLLRYHKVARVQDAVVQVYDYYEPSESRLETKKHITALWRRQL